jgi:hypothetical protein
VAFEVADDGLALAGDLLPERHRGRAGPTVHSGTATSGWMAVSQGRLPHGRVPDDAQVHAAERGADLRSLEERGVGAVVEEVVEVLLVG